MPTGHDDTMVNPAPHDWRERNEALRLADRAAKAKRPPDKTGRVSRTVYPIKYLVVTGELTTGFQFYGPFNTRDAAGQWATGNLKSGLPHRVHDMFDVRNSP